MDAISSQRQSSPFARSFSSLPSNQAAEGERAQRGHAMRRAHCVSPPCHKPRDGEPQAEASARMQYRRSEGASLFIETQEGDTVELKISVRQSTTLAATQAQDGEQTSTAVEKTSRLGARISFEVDGQLNEQERAAIESVIGQVGQLAQQFFDDGVAGAFDAAAALRVDATQLASVGVKLSLREQMTYTSKGLPANVIPLPAPQAVPTTPATPATDTGTNAVAPPAAATAVTPPTAEEAVPTPAAESAEAAATPAVEAPPATATAAPASSPADTIRGFLTQLLQKLSAPAPGSTSGAGLELSLKLRIFQSVVTQTAATQAADTGTDPALSPLVPETLDRLAAKQEAPLQAVA